MLKKARRALRNCVTRHKGIHRRKVANTAVRCGLARQEGEALAMLAKGHDLSLQQPARQKPPISPTMCELSGGCVVSAVRKILLPIKIFLPHCHSIPPLTSHIA